MEKAGEAVVREAGDTVADNNDDGDGFEKEDARCSSPAVRRPACSSTTPLPPPPATRTHRKEEHDTRNSPRGSTTMDGEGR